MNRDTLLIAAGVVILLEDNFKAGASSAKSLLILRDSVHASNEIYNFIKPEPLLFDHSWTTEH